MRQSGILLHITSLPSRFGIGDLGPSAEQFLQFLHDSGQSVWQVLPLNPTDPICDNSPYSSSSAFAVNPMLISPERLVEEGCLDSGDLEGCPHFPADHVAFEEVIPFKQRLLDKAYANWKETEDFKLFYQRELYWLKDFALFSQLKKFYSGKCWNQWPDAFKDAHPEALDQFAEEYSENIGQIYFEQFMFFKQWSVLRQKARALGISIMGDIPIYVNWDSVDVWTHPQVFKLNEHGGQDVVAGVPPDYFSPTGQRWGNPVYNWEYLQETDFDWWVKRLKFNLDLCDLLRIDHFRAFVNYWEIPIQEKDAVNGYWVNVPTDAFFQRVREVLGSPQIIAEDLGQINEEVYQKIHSLGFPGMKILQFAFGDDLKTHMYLPHNYSENCVVYTGTHDNNTVRGWFDEEALPKERSNFLKYIFNDAPKAIPQEMIRLALESRAALSLFPMQDILGLGKDARMNTPGSGSGNWRWRLEEGQLNKCVAERIREQTIQADRVNKSE